MYKIVSLIADRSPFSTLSVGIIGAGCGGVITASRFSALGFGQVRIFSNSFFGIEDCTVKVTQLHLSGLEYIGNLDSAKACIQGGMEFLSLFGPHAMGELQRLGILEPRGTSFTFSADTLQQHTPTRETVLQHIPILESFYQTLKHHEYAQLILPETLFSPIVFHASGAIEIATIQPGIAIMRLGAFLKQHLEAQGVELHLGKKIESQSICREGERYLINGLACDVVINATNGAFEAVNAAVASQSETFSTRAHMVKNNRYQLYVEAKGEALFSKFPYPMYTLCTANAGHQNHGFYGSMLDRLTLSQDRACLVLYAAGPSNARIGGGSWGESFLPLNAPEPWKNQTDLELHAIQTRIIDSVALQFPVLNEVVLTPLFLHNGYNLNSAMTQGRSDMRPFVEPEINSESPLFITQFCLKFTHSAYTSKRVVDTWIDTQLRMQGFQTDQRLYYQACNHRFQFNVETIDSDKLTVLAHIFCQDALVPKQLIPYFSEPKGGRW